MPRLRALADPARRLVAPVISRLDARAAHQARQVVADYHATTFAPFANAVASLERRIEALEARAAEPVPPEVFVPPLPGTIDADAPFMVSSTATASDCMHPRFAELAAMWGERPLLHRKLWEHVFVVHHLITRGALTPGRRGLGFGVGNEALPALFASMGCRITATDAPVDTAIDEGWRTTGQYATGIDTLSNPGLLEPERFRELVDFRSVDMNAIDDDLRGFDFIWSSCCFEHLGSLQRGIDFVLDSTERCLMPGGIAVHTTEFNLSSNDDTLESADVSFYRHRDLEALIDELNGRGHRAEPVTIASDALYLDHFVDVPPYRQQLHLKVATAGYTVTSVGIVVERRPS